MDKIEKITEHLFKVTTKTGIVKYRVSYNSKKYLCINRKFTNLEDAQLFQRTCQEMIDKKRIEKLTYNDVIESVEYPENLLNAIGINDKEFSNYYTEIVPNFEKNFDKARQVLNLREEDVILSIYKHYQTLETTGKDIGVTRERVRQIAAKALKKLRHSSNINYFIKGTDRLELISCEERKALYEEIKSQMTYEIALEIVKEHDKQIEEEKKNAYVDSGIEELDLSVRSYNCLKRARIKTIKELCNMNEAKVIKIRNLGKKSFREIKEKLAYLGLSFKE